MLFLLYLRHKKTTQWVDAERLKLEKQIKLITEKLEITQKLFDEGITSKFELLGQQEALINLEQEFKKTKSRLVFQKLHAPIDGMIQELAIHTIGDVVNTCTRTYKSCTS